MRSVQVARSRSGRRDADGRQGRARGAFGALPDDVHGVDADRGPRGRESGRRPDHGRGVEIDDEVVLPVL
jgi:hypothetical protein